MSCSDLFLRTLRLIRYPEVDFLDDSDVDSIISEKELGSFFEVFGTLSEKNVLTTEEIEEYSALSPAELLEIENVQVEDDAEYEKKKGVLFLQEQLAHIANHNKTIERQVNLFKNHEENLLKEKESQQKLLLDAKKRLQTYEISKIPLAEEEFVSSLKSIMEVADDLKCLIMNSETSESKLPTSDFFKDLIQQYLISEEKVLQCVKAYLETNFKLREDDTLFVIADENLQRQELRKEALFLQKVLKNNMMSKVETEIEMQKFENMVKYLETMEPSDFNCPLSQIRFKVEDASKVNYQLKKKEHDLKAYASDTGSKYIDALLTEIDLCSARETCSTIQFCSEKLSLPMNMLINQRARFEILITFLSKHKQQLQIIKDLIQKVLSQIEQEKLELEKRKNLIESKMTDIVQKKSEPDHVATVLSSFDKILEYVDNCEISRVSVSDLTQKADKLLEIQENCTNKSQENMKTIDLLEKHSQSMESLLNCVGKEYSNWHELEQELNVNLNKLDLKLASLEGNMSECNQDLDQKHKVLEGKGNLRLSRNLYIYALLNKDLFKKCIDEIKIAMENCTDNKS